MKDIYVHCLSKQSKQATARTTAVVTVYFAPLRYLAPRAKYTSIFRPPPPSLPTQQDISNQAYECDNNSIIIQINSTTIPISLNVAKNGKCQLMVSTLVYLLILIYVLLSFSSLRLLSVPVSQSILRPFDI